MLLLPARGFVPGKVEVADLAVSAFFGVVVGVLSVLPVTACLISVARLLAGAVAGALGPEVVAEVLAGASSARVGTVVSVDVSAAVVVVGGNSVVVAVEVGIASVSDNETGPAVSV